MLSHEKGLTSEEVLARRKQHGANVLPEKPRPSHLVIFFSQLKNPLIFVLLIASFVTIGIGHYPDAIIILLAVILNTVLGFFQEHKASDALYALRKFVTNKATAIRDGKRIALDAAELVPGDIVILSQGVKIPADGKILFANRLYLNEAILTGESASVRKEKSETLFMGTTVAAGQAEMVVEKTGAHTEIGKIALEIQQTEEDTPFQRQLKIFSRQLLIVVGVLTVLVFVTGIWNHLDTTEIFVTSIALAVSSIPEGLIVSLTVVLAIGMQKILQRRGLVRKLAAAETLGGVTIICVDKTGTLTEGQMEVVEYIGDQQELAEQVLLANDLDDPIVISAFEWGQTIIGHSVSEHHRLDSIPFSSKDRFFVSLHHWSAKKNRVFVNGAPEHILEWTTLSGAERQKVLQQIDDLTRRGKRVVGFARKDVSKEQTDITTADAKSNLTWVGMLAFSDPVRRGIKEALQQAKQAGIRTIVITGDYPKTSAFVLSELGITLTKEEIITGDELQKLSTRELAERIQHVQLFARTTPDQKMMIVEALKRRGEVVAMMGDGVNDAPALHKADIGIAVGDATDVAKESADLVLIDPDFSIIIGAIEEGRAMFENIRKIILYLMSDAFAEVFVVFCGIFLGLPLPITAVQILWINLVSDGLPNLALTIDPKRKGLMRELPRSTTERLVSGWMLFFIGTISVIVGLFAFVAFFIVFRSTGDVITARSMVFLTLGFCTLTYVFSIRTLLTPFWQNHIFENKWLVLAVMAGIILQVLPFTSAPLRQFFGLNSLPKEYWLIAIGLSLVMFFVVECFKYGYQAVTSSRND